MKCFLTISFCTLFLLQGLFSQTAPGMPALGPGGSDAIVHAGFDSAFYGTDQTDAYWLFEPNNPKPAEAYVIVYWHGHTSLPSHQVGSAVSDYCVELVKRGYTVVAPLYQWGDYTPNETQKSDHFRTVTEVAFTELDQAGHVAPIKDGNGKVIYSVIGYSFGGGTVLTGAANLSSTEIIPPKSITCFAPAAAASNLSGIPDSVKLAIQVGVDDGLISQGMVSWSLLDQIPCENKIFLIVNRNSGISSAGHIYHTMAATDANDYYASWKYSVGMADCSMKGTHCDYVLTNRDSITYMGSYSDGTPLVPMTIYDNECLPYEDTATYLTLVDTIKVVPIEGTVDFDIETDGNWIIKYYGGWLELDQTEGKFDRIISIDYDENASANDKVANIIITSPEYITDTIKLIQAGGSISVDNAAVSLGMEANSNAIINVSSNTLWAISSSDSWISLSAIGGLEDNAITIEAKSANAGATRQGTVTISSPGLSDIEISVTQIGATSVKTFKTNGIKMFPNPVGETLNISNIAEYHQIQLLNTTGQVVGSYTIHLNETTLNVGQLESGCYILQLINDKEVVSETLIKQ